jgi:CelD/BcsL family acetyltransferase involved in cellulose biosynthesis
MVAAFRSMPRPHYTVETATTEDEVCSLQQDWERLSAVSKSPNAFTTFDWYQAWYRGFAQSEGAGKRSHHILVLKRNGAVAGISPLVGTVSSRMGFRMRRLQFVSGHHDWDYNDLVLGDDAEGQIQAVVEYLSHTQSEWDILDLWDLRDIEVAKEHIENALRRASLRYLFLPEEERCPYMPIDGSWSAIISRRSSSIRHTYRNQQSRLNRMSSEGLRVRILDDPSKEPGLLQKMVALEEQKRVGGQLSAPFLALHSSAFESIFDALGPKGWLCVALMELNDQLLAWHLLLRCGGKLWGYLTAYDHDYSRLSPGRMLVPAIIDYGFARGYTEYDFMNGEETYKLQWAAGFRQTYRLLVWNRRWKSRFSAFAYLKLRAQQQAHRSNADEQPDATSIE